MSITTERMIDSAPDYYQYSEVFRQIQQAQALEYDNLEAQNEDLRKQLYITTATWGLKYWEQLLRIPTVEADGYEIRRSRVLSSWRGYGQFSAELIKSVAEAYTNGEVAVSVDIPSLSIQVQFVSSIGVPPNIFDLQALLDNIIHAHLGITYKYKYLVIKTVEGMTIDEVQARPLSDFLPFVLVQ